MKQATAQFEKVDALTSPRNAHWAVDLKLEDFDEVNAILLRLCYAFEYNKLFCVVKPATKRRLESEVDNGNGKKRRRDIENMQQELNVINSSIQLLPHISETQRTEESPKLFARLGELDEKMRKIKAEDTEEIDVDPDLNNDDSDNDE